MTTKKEKEQKRVHEQIEQGSKDLARAMGKEKSVVEKATTPVTDLAREAREAKEAAIARAKEAREKLRQAMEEKKKAMDAARAEAKKNREAKAAEAKAAKEAKKNAEPDFVEQLDEHGKTELVDRTKNPVLVVCSVCGSERWVTRSQAHEVTMCKLHARKTRRQRRMQNRKERAKGYKEIVEAAIEQGLFPEAFKKKWGI